MYKLHRLQEFWIGQIRLPQVIFEDRSVIGIPKGRKTEIEVRDAEAEPFSWSFAGGQTLSDREKIVPVPIVRRARDPCVLKNLCVVVNHHVVPGYRHQVKLALHGETFNKGRINIAQEFLAERLRRQLVQRYYQVLADSELDSFCSNVDEIGRLPRSNLSDQFVQIVRP